ncbi:MAG: ABC transporter transmembrane domain-containing protein, partial [Acidobacteriota bacterium]
MKRKKMPFIMRMTPTDSAAACVAMVSGYHGRHIPLEEVRLHLGGSRRGTTDTDLAEALGHQGFDVETLAIDDIELEDSLPPFLSRWRWKEFVVVERVDGDRVWVVDPRVGRYRLSREEWLESAGGHALVPRPGASFEPIRKRQLPWRRYMELLRRRWPQPVKIVGTSVALQTLALLFPLLTAVVVDELVPNRRFDLLWIVAMGLLAFGLVQATISFVRQVLVLRLERALDRELVQDFFRHLLRLPLSFFELRSAGDLLMQVNSNSVIRSMLSSVAISVVLDAGLAATYLVLMFLFEPRLAILVALLGAVQLALTTYAAKVQHHYSQRSVLAQSSTQSLVMEMLAGIGTLKVAAAEGRAEKRWRGLFDRQLEANYQQQWTGAVFAAAHSAVSSAGPMFLLVYGAYLVLGG